MVDRDAEPRHCRPIANTRHDPERDMRAISKAITLKCSKKKQLRHDKSIVSVARELIALRYEFARPPHWQPYQRPSHCSEETEFLMEPLFFQKK